MSIISKEFVRFVIVGVTATIIHYGVYLLLLQIVPQGGVYEEIAYGTGYVVSFIFNFILTSVFTFKTKANAKKTIGFVMSHAINFGLHLGLFKCFKWLSLPEISIALATFERIITPLEYIPILIYSIAVPVNFLLVRFAFKSKWTQ